MAISLSVPPIDIRERISDEVIHELARRIGQQFHPERIFLFGSYAYGTPAPESDIDLLVIMPTSLREIQQAIKIRQYLNPLFGLDILVYKPDQVHQRLEIGDPFLKEIIEKGVLLYESPLK